MLGLDQKTFLVDLTAEGYFFFFFLIYIYIYVVLYNIVGTPIVECARQVHTGTGLKSGQISKSRQHQKAAYFSLQIRVT